MTAKWGQQDAKLVQRILKIVTKDSLLRDLFLSFWHTFRSIFNKLLCAKCERSERRSVLLSLLIFVLVRLCSLLLVFLHICIDSCMYICKMLMLAHTHTRLLQRCYIFTRFPFLCQSGFWRTSFDLAGWSSAQSQSHRYHNGACHAVMEGNPRKLLMCFKEKHKKRFFQVNIFNFFWGLQMNG